MKLRIGLRLMWLNGRGYSNFIGDHSVAIGWQKYLHRRDDVEAVYIAGPGDPLPHDLHCVIHFHHDCERQAGAKNFYYCQNAWPRGISLQRLHQNYVYMTKFPGGTPEVFNFFKERFDGYLFPSEVLKGACGVGDISPAMVGAAVIPFATDPEVFTHQPDPRFTHPVCFVGNDIRGPEANEAYLVPALKHGLVIYGGPYSDPRLQAVNRGRASPADLPKIYSSSQVVLNVHIPIAAETGMVNMRVYEALACGGLVVSDWHPAMIEFMGRVVAISPDGDPAKGPSIDDVLRVRKAFGPPDIDARRQEWREFVLAKHTWAHRMETLVAWLKGVL